MESNEDNKKIKKQKYKPKHYKKDYENKAVCGLNFGQIGVGEFLQSFILSEIIGKPKSRRKSDFYHR